MIRKTVEKKDDQRTSAPLSLDYPHAKTVALSVCLLSEHLKHLSQNLRAYVCVYVTICQRVHGV